MIRIICTILKRRDGKRRWKLISSHSGAEVLQADVDKWNSCSKPSCSVNSSPCRLSTRHPNQATVSPIIYSVQFISVVHLTQEMFEPIIKNRKVFLFFCLFVFFNLTSQLLCGWLHKCVSMFQLMTSSMTSSYWFMWCSLQPCKCKRAHTALTTRIFLNCTGECARGSQPAATQAYKHTNPHRKRLIKTFKKMTAPI